MIEFLPDFHGSSNPPLKRRVSSPLAVARAFRALARPSFVFKSFWIALLFMALGCSTLGDGQEIFRKSIDGYVGTRIDEFSAREPENKYRGVNESVYVYRATRAKCYWAFTVDDETGLISSWTYVTPAENCRASFFGSL